MADDNKVAEERGVVCRMQPVKKDRPYKENISRVYVMSQDMQTCMHPAHTNCLPGEMADPVQCWCCCCYDNGSIAEGGAAGSHSAMERRTLNHDPDTKCTVGCVILMSGTVNLPHILVEGGMNTTSRLLRWPG